MFSRSLAWSPLVALLLLLTGMLVLSGLVGSPSEAAQATPQPLATAPRAAGRTGLSPAVLGDINNDGIVDTRDYGIWRQNFGATDCGNPADLTAPASWTSGTTGSGARTSARRGPR